MLRCVIALVCLVALVIAQESPWQGVWTDGRFKGRTYLCVSGNQIQGSFSNIGWINGIISEDGSSVNGTWGMSGYGISQAGNFEWLLLAGNDTFTGSFWDTQLRCKTNPWAPGGITSRISQIVTQEQCQITGFGSMTGRWANEDNSLVIDVCQQNGLIQISYVVDETNRTILGKSGQGFSWGLTYNDGIYAQASYIDDVYVGIEYYQILASGQLLNGYYPNYTSPFEDIDFNLDYNFVVILNSVSTGANNQSCLRNQDLIGPSWAGVWSDLDFGYGKFYICTDGSNIWGVYSEVGWVEGVINATDPLNIYGQFYDAGDDIDGQGNFTLRMSADGQTFQGQWIFENQDIFYPWTATRLSDQVPTDAQCITQDLSQTETTSLEGQWYYVLQGSQNVTLDICFNELTLRYQLSYSSSLQDIQGYGLGQITETGIRGQWYETNAEGIEFYRLVNSTMMVNQYWPFNQLQTVQYLPCDGLVSNAFFQQHGQHTWLRSSFTTTQNNCNRNNALVVGVPDLPFVSPSPSPSARPSAFPSSTPTNSSTIRTLSFVVALIALLAAYL